MTCKLAWGKQLADFVLCCLWFLKGGKVFCCYSFSERVVRRKGVWQFFSSDVAGIPSRVFLKKCQGVLWKFSAKNVDMWTTIRVISCGVLLKFTSPIFIVLRARHSFALVCSIWREPFLIQRLPNALRENDQQFLQKSSCERILLLDATHVNVKSCVLQFDDRKTQARNFCSLSTVCDRYLILGIVRYNAGTGTSVIIWLLRCMPH